MSFWGSIPVPRGGMAPQHDSNLDWPSQPAQAGTPAGTQPAAEFCAAVAAPAPATAAGGPQPPAALQHTPGGRPQPPTAAEPSLARGEPFSAVGSPRAAFPAQQPAAAGWRHPGASTSAAAAVAGDGAGPSSGGGLPRVTHYAGLPSPDSEPMYPTSHLPTVRTREELEAALAHPSAFTRPVSPVSARVLGCSLVADPHDLRPVIART